MKHSPFRPARPDMAEAVFLSRWQALNVASDVFLPSILGHSRAPVRSARVAASFITWIGSNVGACFIREAKLAIAHHSYAEPAYLTAWALANRRVFSVSSNVRAIEVILSPASLFNQAGGTPFELASQMNISLADMDVIESIVIWLSTAHGDSFVTACELEHRANLARIHSQHNAKVAESEYA